MLESAGGPCRQDLLKDRVKLVPSFRMDTAYFLVGSIFHCFHLLVRLMALRCNLLE
jgi:hypothetical protein